MITYFQAMVLGIVQGVTELFPVSSLGHAVIVPKLLGWNSFVTSEQGGANDFLTFLVALHVATALGLFIQYRKDWFRIFRGFFRSINHRRIQTPSERLCWLIVIGTIPAGLIGFVFEKKLRELFAKPTDAAVFLILNGIVLFVGYLVEKRNSQRLFVLPKPHRRNTGKLPYFTGVRSLVIGFAQSFALLAGFSRDGLCMTAGLLEGLDMQDAARFSFMLSTPIIFAAGLLKAPHLLSHSMRPLLGQTILGSLFALVTSLLSVKFLIRYFKSRSLAPFSAYCIIFGTVSLFAIK